MAVHHVSVMPSLQLQMNGLKLSNSWAGYRVLLNPEFSSSVQWRFVNRAIDEVGPPAQRHLLCPQMAQMLLPLLLQSLLLPPLPLLLILSLPLLLLLLLLPWWWPQQR